MHRAETIPGLLLSPQVHWLDGVQVFWLFRRIVNVQAGVRRNREKLDAELRYDDLRFPAL